MCARACVRAHVHVLTRFVYMQVVGCGVGPVLLTPEERQEWKDLGAGHYRIPPDPREWDPVSLLDLS